MDLERSLRDAAALLGARGRRRLPFEPDLHPLAGSGPASAVAVDGSHAVLVDSGAAWVVAVRAAAVAWPGPPAPEAPSSVHAAMPGDAAEEAARRYTELGLRAPPPPRSAEAFAQQLRAAAEAEAARAALRSLGPEDLLLLDGALEGLPPEAGAVAADLVEAAAAGGVPLAAVAKRSSLQAGGAPLVPTLHRVGQARLRDAAWWTPVPGMAMAHVARLHPRAPFAYRVDVPDATTLARLPPLCRDAVYLGYPYPLALAHNAVALTASRREALLHRLEDTVRRAGGQDAVALLADPHAMLDENVP